MNILDILIAKNKSFTGETASLVRQANAAMAAANEVAEKATAAQTALEAAQAAQSTYENLDTEIQALVSAAQGAQSAVADKVNSITIDTVNNSTVKTKKITVNKNNNEVEYVLDKNYTTTGQNEDGSMTQKAITNALNLLTNRINNLPSNPSSGNISGNITAADKGNLVIVDENGNIAASTASEDILIKTEILVGTYQAKNAVGVEIDYENKNVSRLQDARSLSAGNDFNAYSMFGGRKRCIVDDSGTIIAFYGDDNYIEDGSLGQVMVYQPKFYYLKMPLKTTKDGNKEKINKEILLLSATKQSGFKLHPLFINADGNEVDYALLSAYEGCAYDTSAISYNLSDSQDIDFNTDKLSSIANAKPISGATQLFTITNAEKIANNRGAGWSLTNLAAESANQMLMVVEYASLNLQNAFYKGITNTPDYAGVNCSSITGSTSSLGSTSGQASSSIQTHSGISETFNVDGKCAISYRGFENPYGNAWRFISGAKIINNQLTYNNHIFTSTIPASPNWISSFGYDADMPWTFFPTECNGANSALPVGDFTYVADQQTGENCCVIGGKNNAGDYAGPFYYGMDYSYDTHARSYSARIMYIPTPDTEIYTTNIEKWNNEVGGE